MLDAGDFKTLQRLMLENQAMTNKFYGYDIRTPEFKGDTWKAFYLKDISEGFGKVVKRVD